jgi:hypothetical protein
VRARPEPVWIVPAALLATTYPHLLVVWHFSGYEVDRHALEAALLLRLGVILLLIFAFDRAVAWWLSSRGGPSAPRRASPSPSAG